MMGNRVVFRAKLGELAEIPGTPFAYWAPASLRELFRKHPPLDRDVARMPDQPKIADVKQGLATADDLRFTRYWWEVPVERIAISREETLQGKKWVPFAKGGQPFYHDVQLVVNWANDGKEIKDFIVQRYPYLKGKYEWVAKNESFYFGPGLSWAPMATTNRMDFAVTPKGCVFSHAGGSGQLFVSSAEALWSCCGLTNATLLFAAFRLMNPLGHGKEAGVVARLFVAEDALRSRPLSCLAREAHDLLRQWATGDETATVFVVPWIMQARCTQNSGSHAELLPTTGHPLARDFTCSPWESARRAREVLGEVDGEGILRPRAVACTRWEQSVQRRVEEIQREIDDEVYGLYRIGDEDRALIEAELRSSGEPDEEPGEDTEQLEEEETPRPRTLLSPEEHIRRLVHYVAHEAVREDPDGIVPLFDLYTAAGELERGLVSRVQAKLSALFGEGNMPILERELREALGMTLDEWLASEFFGYHVSLYRLRPVVWYLESRTRGRPAFGCFVYWHTLDADTLRKVQHVYLRPVLEGAQREAERLAARYAEKKKVGASTQELREAEQVWRQTEQRAEELRSMSKRIQCLDRPQALSVATRSAWVAEKVNEIMAQGYHPNRDYGVRVNIEPLKQAGVLAADASRVKG